MTQDYARIIEVVASWFAVGIDDRIKHIANKYPHGWTTGYTDGRIDTTRRILGHALAKATRAERTNIGRVIRHELDRHRELEKQRSP